MFITDRIGVITPPECHPGQQAYTFLICILSTSSISVSIFSVCCYSRVSISVSIVLTRDFYLYMEDQGPYIYLDPRSVPPFSLAWLVTGCNTLVAEKPVIESKHQLRPGPVDHHLLMGS